MKLSLYFGEPRETEDNELGFVFCIRKANMQIYSTKLIHAQRKVFSSTTQGGGIFWSKNPHLYMCHVSSFLGLMDNFLLTNQPTTSPNGIS